MFGDLVSDGTDAKRCHHRPIGALPLRRGLRVGRNERPTRACEHFLLMWTLQGWTWQNPPPRAMLANRVGWSRKASLVVPVGPLRCLATMISAVPRSFDSWL